MNQKNSSRAKRNRLVLELKRFDTLLVAFSSGVDSTFMLAVAHEVIGVGHPAVGDCGHTGAGRGLDVDAAVVGLGLVAWVLLRPERGDDLASYRPGQPALVDGEVMAVGSDQLFVALALEFGNQGLEVADRLVKLAFELLLLLSLAPEPAQQGVLGGLRLNERGFLPFSIFLQSLELGPGRNQPGLLRCQFLLDRLELLGIADLGPGDEPEVAKLA